MLFYYHLQYDTVWHLCVGDALSSFKTMHLAKTEDNFFFLKKNEKKFPFF